MWRNKAIEIRAQFERNRNVRDPRAVAALLNEAEKEVQKYSHPDPYRRALASCPLPSSWVGLAKAMRCADRTPWFTLAQPHSSPTAPSGALLLEFAVLYVLKLTLLVLQGAQLAGEFATPQLASNGPAAPSVRMTLSG